MSRPLTSAITVFIASPGGVEEERDIAEDAARAAGEDLGVARGVAVIVRRWEQVIGEAGNAQSQINPDVDDADIFIGIVHTHWGMETGNGFDSGFGEEFERALTRWEATREPKMHLFFKAVDPAMLADPGEQLRKVLAFRRWIEQEHQAFYKTYAHARDLRHLIYRALATHLALLPDSAVPIQSSQPPPAEERAELEERPGPLSDAVTHTLRSFAKVMGGEGFEGELDFDRLELFALAVSRDGDGIPVHLANRTYLRRHDLQPTWLEMRALLRAFLRDRGGSRDPRDYAVPFMSMLPTRAALAALLVRYARDLLRSTDGTIVRGWLRVATTLGVRPAALWKQEFRSERGSAELVSLWTQAIELGSEDDALLYWLQVAEIADLERGRRLAGSDVPRLQRLGALIVSLTSPEPNAKELADSYPNLLLRPSVRRLFGGQSPLQTLAEPALAALCLKSSVMLDLRSEALHELVRRDAVPAAVIVDAMKRDRYERSTADGWTVRAEAALFDRPVSDGFLATFTSAVASLDASGQRGARRSLARLLRHNPRFDLASPLEATSSEFSPDGVAYRLAHWGGTPRARNLALSIVDDSNTDITN